MPLLPHIPYGTENNARQILKRLGMGDFNATMVMQFMFVAPAATDPAMPPVVLMTRHLQQGLVASGADCGITGIIDDQTAKCLEALVGPKWHQMSWYHLMNAVIRAKQRRSFTSPQSVLPPLGAMPDLPSIPGGLLTVALVAAGAYLLIGKKA
jgi:hypothetical protein